MKPSIEPVEFKGLEALRLNGPRGASAVAKNLGLPPQAFTYLTSHGALDQDHMVFFAELVNGLDDPADRAAILGMAREMFALFGGVFAGIEMEPARAAA